mgnify:CR=1 FL=1
MKQIIFSGISPEEFKAEITTDMTNVFNQLLAAHLKPNEPAEKIITKKDVSQLFGVSLVTVNEWEKQGKLTGYQIGTRVRFKLSEVLEALKERRVAC